jgi:hypothetical protein
MAVAQQEIVQAEELAQQGKSEAAIAMLSQLIQRDASNAAAWLALSDVVDDPERADYCLRKVLNLDPGNAAAMERLSRSKGGSLSVGAMGSFTHEEPPTGDKAAAASGSAVQQVSDIDVSDRSEPVPASPQPTTEELERQNTISGPEIPSEILNINEGDSDAFSTPEVPSEASEGAGVAAEGAQGKEDQPKAAPAAANLQAQEVAKRSQISRTDLILIGLTVLAGVVLCALVSAALIS